MKEYFPYKHSVGLLFVAAFLYMVVLNLSPILDMAHSFYQAILPLLFGVGIAFILDIVVHRLEKRLWPRTHTYVLRKMRRPLATILGIIIVILLIGFVLYMAIPQTIQSLTLAVANIPALYDKMIDLSLEFSAQYPWLQDTHATDMISRKEDLAKLTNYALSWAGGVMSALSNALSFLFNLVIGFVFSIYLLLNKSVLLMELDDILITYFGKTMQRRVHYVWQVTTETFSSFFVGQFLDALILGAMVGIGMGLFQLPHALTIGCVVGFTALVPLVGAYVGAAMGTLILIVENPMHAVIFLIILIVMQQIESNLVYPKIVGDSIGLPGIYVFAAIILGGNLYGVTGMLLSVPLAATLYRILRDDMLRRQALRQKEGDGA